ncbi:MAG TPA: amino acid ABC transporter substrate-binding protein [Anaerolineales bacterium]|nr:amino acid ABC transporter substrate-binding protein [Anaerolineales bacterium]
MKKTNRGLSKRIILQLIPVVLVLSLMLAACGAPAPATEVIPQTGATEPAMTEAPATEAATQPSMGELPASIKVGVVVPLTGRYAAGGDQVRNGYELAVEDINKAGGVEVMGKKIPLELVIRDDESDPTKTVQNMESLNSDEHVVAYLGGFGSDLHAAAAAIAEKNKIPYLGVAFALYKIHQQGYKYLFSPFPKSPALAKAYFDVFDTLDPKPLKIAIFAEKTDWGAELGGAWQQEAKARGYELVANETYAPGSTDFSDLILKAKDGGAQAVLALPNPPDALALVKQMKELDFNPGIIAIVRGADAVTWPKNMGKDGDYVLLSAGGNPEANFPGALDMVKRHEAKFGKAAAGTTAPAYSVVQILVDAIQRANSLDPTAIRDAIAATNMTTVAGPVTFNPDGTGNVITVVSQYQNGQQKLVWPKDIAVVPVMYPAPAWNKR